MYRAPLAPPDRIKLTSFIISDPFWVREIQDSILTSIVWNSLFGKRPVTRDIIIFESNVGPHGMTRGDCWSFIIAMWMKNQILQNTIYGGWNIALILLTAILKLHPPVFLWGSRPQTPRLRARAMTPFSGAFVYLYNLRVGFSPHILHICCCVWLFD